MRYSKILDLLRPVTWITAYDYPTGVCCERAEIDMILVGDSGGMVQLGYENTKPVTMEEMLTMCKAVRRGAPSIFIVGDMPLGGYEESDAKAVENAVAFIKAGCDAVKIEGGGRIGNRAGAIHNAGIDIIGHLGMTPQSMKPSIIGKTEEQVSQLVTDTNILRSFGVKMILYEAVKGGIMSEVVANTSISKYMGIGSGLTGLDGQLLIIHDILGYYDKFRPKFAKLYFEQAYKEAKKEKNDPKEVTMLDVVTKAIVLYKNDVIAHNFPTEEYTY